MAQDLSTGFSQPLTTIHGTERKRIARACDRCRIKKTKCNGDAFCNHCRRSNLSCTYGGYNYSKSKFEDVSDEENHSPPLSLGRGEIKKLPIEHRLTRIETMLERILSGMSRGSAGTRHGDSESDEEFDPIAVSHYVQLGEQKNLPPVMQAMGANETSSCTYQIPVSLFSAEGFQWIQSTVGDPSAVTPFDRLNMLTHRSYLKFQNIYAKPIGPSDLHPLPPSETINVLLHNFSTQVLTQFSMFEHGELVPIFDSYFASLNANQEVPIGKVFLVNVILLLGAQVSAPTDPAMAKLEDELLVNCVFYFHRVSIVGGGLDAVKSLTLMVVYTISSAVPQYSSTILSAAVRLGQELGLHRREQYTRYSKREAFDRRLVWCQLYFLDKLLCLKTGKPMLIDERDTSSISTANWIPYMKSFIAGGGRDTIYDIFQDVPQLAINEPGDSLPELFKKILTVPRGIFTFVELQHQLLWFMVPDIYNKLFSGKALDNKKINSAIDDVESFNKEIMSWASLLPDFLQPGNLSTMLESQRFIAQKLDPQEQVVALQRVAFMHFTYYLLVLTVNRFASGPVFKSSHSRLQKLSLQCRERSFEAARSMVGLAKAVNCKLLYDIVLGSYLFATTTLFCAILETPLDHKADIDLLYESGREFTEQKPAPTRLDTRRCSFAFTFYSLVRISMRHYNNASRAGDKYDLSEITMLCDKYESILEHQDKEVAASGSMQCYSQQLARNESQGQEQYVPKHSPQGHPPAGVPFYTPEHNNYYNYTKQVPQYLQGYPERMPMNLPPLQHSQSNYMQGPMHADGMFLMQNYHIPNYINDARNHQR